MIMTEQEKEQEREQLRNEVTSENLRKKVLAAQNGKPRSWH